MSGRRIDVRTARCRTPIAVAVVLGLGALPGCAWFGGASSVEDVCAAATIGDVFGTTGTFADPQAALGSVVDDPGAFEHVGGAGAREFFAGPGSPPAQVVELEQGPDGWSVFAVSTCRR